MTRRPKLSIVTPSLNQGRFIERTIRSVLDQGYENLEYLVVDGGSNDESVETIERYQDQLAWWVSEPDEGQTDALNKGFARATGDIVAYINSDDYYLPGAFERAVSVLEQGDALWMAGAARFVDDRDRVSHVWTPDLPDDVRMPIGGRHWWALRPWSVPQPSAFWRRRAFTEVGLMRTDLHYAFDTEFFLRLAYAGFIPDLVDDELSVRVVHAAAKSADRAPFEREIRKLAAIERPAMTRSERIRLRLTSVLLRLGVFRMAGRARRSGARLAARGGLSRGGEEGER